MVKSIYHLIYFLFGALIFTNCSEKELGISRSLYSIDSSKIYIPGKTIKNLSDSLYKAAFDALNSTDSIDVKTVKLERLYPKIGILQNSFTVQFFLDYLSFCSRDSVKAISIKCLNLIDKIYGGNSCQAILLKKSVGIKLNGLNEYNLADSVLTYCFQKIDNATNCDSTVWADVLFYLSSTKRQKAEYDFASKGMYLCLNYASKIQDSFLLIKTLNELSIIEGSNENLSKAFAQVDSAFTLAKKLKDTIQIRKSLLIYGALSSYSKSYDDAQYAYKQGLRFTRNQYEETELLSRIIENYCRWNKIDSATKYFELIVNPNHKEPTKQAYIFYVESLFHLKAKGFENSLEAINNAIEITGKSLNKTRRLDEWNLLYLALKANIYLGFYTSENNKYYLEEIEQIFDTIDAQIESYFLFNESGDELHAIDLLHQTYFEGAKIYLSLYRKFKNQEYLQKAIQFSERMRSRILFRNIRSNKMQEEHAEIGIELFSKIKALEKNIDALLKSNQLTELYRKQNLRKDLIDSLQSCCKSTYQNWVQKKEIQIDSLKSWSRRDSSIIISTYVGRDGDLILFSIRPDTVSFEYIPTELEIIKQLKSVEDTKNKNGELYNEYFKELLGTKLSKLIILADVELENIKFQNIFINDTLVFEDQYDIYFSYTLAHLLDRNPKQSFIPEKPRILSLVNANRGDADLPYTYNEGQFIENKFRGSSKVLYGKNATFKNFNKYKDDYNVYHFALHGQGHPEFISECGIYFKDKFVNINQIQNWNSAKLVVLNICLANEGKAYRGEGVFNIQRTVGQSGANNVVSNYYTIDDFKAYSSVIKFFGNERTNSLKKILF